MQRPGVPVFKGQGSTLTRAGVWRVVTGLMTVVRLDPHDAPHLYRARGADLEIVQEQLGHASISPDPRKTLNRRYQRHGRWCANPPEADKDTMFRSFKRRT